MSRMRVLRLKPHQNTCVLHWYMLCFVTLPEISASVSLPFSLDLMAGVSSLTPSHIPQPQRLREGFSRIDAEILQPFST